MSGKRTIQRLSLTHVALFLLLAAPSLPGMAWSDTERSGKEFSELLYDARGFFSDFDFSRSIGCGTETAINLLNALFKTRAEFYLGDTSDPDKTRQWHSVSGPPTTINLTWVRVSDKGSAGAILVQAFVSDDCEGKRTGDLKEAYIRYSIPVNGSPGHFSVAPPQDVKVETFCCDATERENYVYNLKGVPLRMAGTDFPPLPPPTPTKPKPATGTGPASGGGAVSAPAGYAQTATAAPAPQPIPRPEPFTMEKVCEPCQSQKAMVDHLKQRLQKLRAERDQANRDLQDNRNRQAQLDKSLKRLEEELKAQKDVGAESTDPATGITTRSYDNGSGTVVVTRRYPDGRIEEIDRYPRRSTQAAQQDLTSQRAEKTRLEQASQRIEQRLGQLDAAMRETDSRLQTALASLASCIDLCNRNIGHDTNYRAKYEQTGAGLAAAASGAAPGTAAEPAGAAVTAAASTPSTAAASGTIDMESKPSSAGTGARVEAAPGQGGAAVVPDQRASATPEDQGAVRETGRAAGGTPQTGTARPKPVDRIGDFSWKADVGIGYKFGKKDLKLYGELRTRGFDEQSDLKLDYTTEIPPSRVMGIKAIWNSPGYRETAKADIRYLLGPKWLGEETLTSQTGSSTTGSGHFKEPPGHAYDPVADGAWDLLDDGAGNLELGAFIGSWFKPKATALGINIPASKGSYDDISDYVLDILDEYEWEEDEGPLFSPRDVGNTVYAAILAAGGSPEEAFRQAKKASDGWHLAFTGGPMFAGGETAGLKGYRLKISPGIAGFVDKPDSFHVSDLNAPWTLAAFSTESLRVLRSYDEIIPNDPLYKKSGGLGKVGGTIMKGLGMLFGGGAGVGVGSADDAEANDQWGLRAVGFTPEGSGRSAWDIYDGMQKNIVVAVIDSGLDLKHPDRPKYIWTNPDEIPNNGLDDDGNGYVDDIHGWNFVSENNNVDDDYGHGTFVTGIIAANTNNGEGIAGINPGARIMVLKASDNEGSARDLAVYRALRYAVDNGARVINISLGNRGKSRLVQIGLNYAHAMGRIVVVAAGNEGGDVAEFTPQGSRRVISVGSMNIDGARRGNSNKGLSLSLIAPGQSIYSLTATHARRDGRIAPIIAGKYHRLNGTSFAAPFVTGAASLVWARNPKLTNTQVEDLLLSSAAAVGQPGWHPESGMGHLAVYNAMVQSPAAAFAPRITEIYLNRERRKVESVDLYGVIRGPVQSYTLDVGRGENPDKDEWQRAFGPSTQRVDMGHIARIPGSFFSRGSQWTIRLSARGANGETRVQQFLIKNEH